MKETINRLEKLSDTASRYISKSSESDLAQKPNPEKWSKKEILGHLIDSAINNLQRFTEIQFENKPYKIRKYDQDELVKANDYQNSDINEIAELWLSINNRITQVMARQTEETLNYEIKLPDGTSSDLRFLMKDYVDHLEHHLKQIVTS